MNLMDLTAIYPRPRTTLRNQEHSVYSSLLRGVKVKKVNQVCSTDITSIPMEEGLYLTAAIDWYSRHVLSWRLSKSLEGSFCIEALENALTATGKTPEIFNTDQGVQFTSHSFTAVLKTHGIQISMDGDRRVSVHWWSTIILNHQTTKVLTFCVRSAYSKATFVRAYKRDDMASFMDAHVWLFETIGGVPKRLAYDNLSTAVVAVGKRGVRTLTRKFIELRSHYLFETRFCNVAAGNEKGHIENSVKRAERAYLTPVPSVTSMEQLNEHLRERAETDLVRQSKKPSKSYGT